MAFLVPIAQVIGTAVGATAGVATSVGGFAAANATGIAALAGAGSSIMGGIAAKQQGDYQNKIAQQNANLAIEKARDAERMGQFERDRLRLEYGQKQARGELAFGAGNVALGAGSALAWQADLEQAREYDLAISRENAQRQVAGFESERFNFLAEGAAAQQRGRAKRTAGFISAGSTLLGEATAVKNLFGGRRT